MVIYSIFTHQIIHQQQMTMWEEIVADRMDDFLRVQYFPSELPWSQSAEAIMYHGETRLFHPSGIISASLYSGSHDKGWHDMGASLTGHQMTIDLMLQHWVRESCKMKLGVYIGD